MKNALQIGYGDTFTTTFMCRATELDKILREIRTKVLSLQREYKTSTSQITIEMAVQPGYAEDIILEKEQQQ